MGVQCPWCCLTNTLMSCRGSDLTCNSGSIYAGYVQVDLLDRWSNRCVFIQACTHKSLHGLNAAQCTAQQGTCPSSGICSSSLIDDDHVLLQRLGLGSVVQQRLATKKIVFLNQKKAKPATLSHFSHTPLDCCKTPWHSENFDSTSKSACVLRQCIMFGLFLMLNIPVDDQCPKKIQKCSTWWQKISQKLDQLGNM